MSGSGLCQFLGIGKDFFLNGNEERVAKNARDFLVDEKLLPYVEGRLLSVLADICYLLFSPLQVSKLHVL
jgi:hypothetical protein